MTAPTSCPRCSAPLDARGPFGLCAGCLLDSGIAELETGEPLPPPPSAEDLDAVPARFEVLEPIGRGGMGVVYRARHRGLDREVALKVMHPGGDLDPALVQRFAREAKTLASLRHPGIVAVHDGGEERGRFYLAMEYVEGLNLRELLRSGPLEPEQALSVAIELCDALEYAHGRGVVHRDVKPENVLLDPDGSTRLVDFGLVTLQRRGRRAAREGAAVGTPLYMAPEQLERPDAVDSRADLYSLGVVLYELLTGELPLGRFDPPSQLAVVGPRVDAIVMRALEKSPDRRFQSAGAMRAELRAALERVDLPGARRKVLHMRLDEPRSVGFAAGVRAVVALAAALAFLSSVTAPGRLFPFVVLGFTATVIAYGEGLFGGRSRHAPEALWSSLVGLLAGLGLAIAAPGIVLGELAGLEAPSPEEERNLRALALLLAVYAASYTVRAWERFRPRRTYRYGR